jgi:hypothetical protein
MAAYSMNSFVELMNTPATFLRTISNMLQDEEANKSPLDSLHRSRVLSLSMVSVFSKDEKVRDEALWMLANLVAADDPTLRAFAIQHVREHNMAAAAARSYRHDSSVTAKSAAYFLYNWAPHIDNAVDARNLIFDLLPTALVRKTGTYDILWAAIRVAENFPEMIPIHALATILRNENLKPVYTRMLWRLIGRAAEETGLVDGCIDTLMLRLEAALEKGDSVSGRIDLLWILSNLLCEDKGVGVFHFRYFTLRKAVENIAWATTDNVVRNEAVMVLANYVARATDREIQRYLATDESLPLLFRTFAQAGTPRVREIAKEGLEVLERYVAENRQEPEVIELSSDDDDATVSEADPCPTAYDLLAGEHRGRESKAVRGLVEMIASAEVGAWVAVPLDYNLTIGDLTNLQHMGYVIQDGYIGINPEIYSGC